MVERLCDASGNAVSSRPTSTRKIEGKCEPPLGTRPRCEIFTAQCNLAKRKFRLLLHDCPVDDDPAVQAWRQDLQQLRPPTPA